MATRAELLAALSRHQGAHNGIDAEVLARDLACDARHIRSLVTPKHNALEI